MTDFPTRTTGSVSDEEILAAVVYLRGREGACSYRSLAERVGMSVTAIKYRVARLVASGRLLASAAAGSIRPAPGPLGQLVITHNVFATPDGHIMMEVESIRHIGIPIPLSVLAQVSGRDEPRTLGALPVLPLVADTDDDTTVN